MRSISDTLRATAARCPDREALVFGATRRSYCELHLQVEHTAAALAARGISPGDRVLLMSPNSDAFVIAVIGIPHPDYGESILAVVVPADGAEPTVESLRARACDRIADYKAPHAVLVHAIPRNPSGKIQKHLLRAELATQGVPGPAAR